MYSEHYRLVYLLLLMTIQVKSQTSSENDISLEDELPQSAENSNPNAEVTISELSTTTLTSSDSSDPSEVTEYFTTEENIPTTPSQTDSTSTELDTSDSTNPSTVAKELTTEENVSTTNLDSITTQELDHTEISVNSDSTGSKDTTEVFTTEKSTTDIVELATAISVAITETIAVNNTATETTTQSGPTANYSPTITISLPTVTPAINARPNDTNGLCKENEVYSCLPLCRRTCNNPISKLICLPIPSYIRLCLRGCTCKNGYLLEKTTGKCVKECPAKQPF